MSPEQIEGRPVDARADLYAIGCVLLQMLTGTPPFTGGSPFSVAYQHIHNEPPTVRSRRPEVPAGLDRLVGRLLAKDPDDRPATAAQVRAELQAWSDPATLTMAVAHRRRPLARVGIVTVAALALPAALLTVWPEPNQIAPPTAVASVSPSASSPTGLPAMSPPVLPTVSPLTTVSASVPARTPSRPPKPSPSPIAAPTVSEQIADLQALVLGLADTGQLVRKNADELIHLLDDLEHLIAAGKQREAGDKLAAIRKKNDDLLAGGKLSAAGHAAIEERLDPIEAAIAAMSPAAR